MFNLSLSNYVLLEWILERQQLACLAVRFLRYELEKGLRAVYIKGEKLSSIFTSSVLQNRFNDKRLRLLLKCFDRNHSITFF